MAKTVVPPKSVEELFEDLSDLKLRIALLAEAEDKLEKREREIKEDVQLEQLVMQGEKRMQRHINQEYRMRRIRQVAGSVIPTAVRVVASILLLCYLGLTVAIAADSTVRVKVMELIMNIEQKYTEFGLEETGEYLDVPAEWDGFYYPAYIPQGMVLTDVLSDTVLYTHSDRTHLWFCDMSDGTKGTLDTENAAVEAVLLNGHAAIISVKEPWVSILWNIDNRVLMVDYTGTREEALQIAESVRMIK